METTTAAPSKTTLYPKILGDIRHLTRSLKERLYMLDATFPGSDRSATLAMTGTVKLHGTHADIRVGLSTGTIVPQSRNNAALTPAKDNFDFAKFCVEQRPAILRLAERVRERWRELHPADRGEGKGGDEDEDGDGMTVILAGEWVGSGIQSKPHTAIRGLSPRLFVLCAIRVVEAVRPERGNAGVWEHIERYADIADEGARLYNIGRGGFFHLWLKLTHKADLDGHGSAEGHGGGDGEDDVRNGYDNPATAAAVADFQAEARRLTDQVHARCPFGAALGVDGPGEGIVWTPSPWQLGEDMPNVPDLWLKTKAENFEGRPQRDANDRAAVKDEGKERVVEEFLRRACHERRLEQGWDYLREMHVERNMKGVGKFLSWVLRDIEVEEKEDVAELKLGNDWKKGAIGMARTWYLSRLEKERGDGEDAAVGASTTQGG